jgi:hypothetical protein
MFYVSHIGHRWAVAAVSYRTLEAAIAEARRSAGDAMQTTVYDCTDGPSGRVVLVLGPDGREIV